MNAACKGAPRPKPGPSHIVVQLDAGDMIDGVILSEEYFGVMVHWNDSAGKRGRSEPCTKEDQTCSGCENKRPVRWKGYLHVYDLLRKRDCFVELTPATGEQIDLQRSPGIPLRGQRIRLKRGDKGKRTRVQVEILPFQGDLSNLPEEKNPMPIMETLWAWGK